MNTSTEFIIKICKFLSKELRLEPQREYRLGDSKCDCMADVFFQVGNAVVFIEVEEGQPHPDTNLTKYWYWIEQKKIKSPVYLIQIFGKEFYDKNYISRTRLCDFIAQKINKSKNFYYFSIPKNKHHPKEKDWQIFSLLEETKKQIVEIVTLAQTSKKEIPYKLAGCPKIRRLQNTR